MQNARALYEIELKEKGVYRWVKSLRALVRPTIALSAVGFYIGAKVYGIPLTEFDYYLIGGVFAFYFGLRTLEKRSGKV
ncbi:MAG: hypothetical protein GXO22_06725 [Aquificae bacterium]|nr:hypothetical protein [Aquificota bacterium]